MDYSLQSLKGAFADARYKESRRGYKLYAALLATTLDQRFLVEYLALFYELHSLTGDDVLVMGARPAQELGIGDPPIFMHELQSLAAVLAHRSDADARSRMTENFLHFMQAQTVESYELARFLGVRTDRFPAMLFFEDLEHPTKMMVWPIGEVAATQFARQLRHLLEEVRERCAWNEARRLPYLVDAVADLRKEERGEYGRWREQNTPINKARNELREYQHALEAWDKIDELRAAFAELQATPDLRVPVENVGQTIAEIEQKGLDHVYAHERRWRSRLPARYRSAVDAFHGVSLSIGRSLKKLPPREEVSATVARLTTELAQLEAVQREQQRAELERKTAELEQVRARVKSAEPVLTVIENVLHIRSCPFGGGSPRAAFNQYGQPDVPRVFISYSHDSPAHEEAVLGLAQRLRDDGIDCWIDQFESSPAAGFPRWMRQQVEVADFVLVICTPTYRRRFDGAEEAGKGLGATYEGLLITQEVYDAGSQNTRFIPVLVRGGSPQDVPILLRGSKWYEVPQGYDLLLRRLTGSEAVEPHPLGGPSWRDRV